MKRFLFLPVLLLSLLSCSKEEEVVTPPPTPTFTLVFSAEEGGTVSTEGGTYSQGSKITVTATPEGQYLFKEWSDGSTVNPREIVVNSDLTLKAMFLKKDILMANFNTTGYSLLNHERNIGYYSSHSSQKLTNILASNYQNGNPGGPYVAVGIEYLDFNDDGLIDYLLKRVQDGKFFFIENEGNTYKEVSLMKDGIDYYNQGARKIVYDDLDRDGYLDIVISAASDDTIEERGLFILKGSPDGFEEIVISQGETEWFHSVTIGDINNDGFGDILIGGRNFFFSFKEDYSFEKITVPTCWSCGMEYERAITHEMLDLNNDGYSDLIVGYMNNPSDHKGSEYYNSTAIYYGISEYPFFESEYLLPSIYENANVTYDVSIIDFDGDGDLDIFSNTNNFNTPGYMIQYYENNGDGTFSNNTELVFENNSNINMNHYQIDWIKVFDIDGDGNLELMIEGQNWKKREDGEWGWLVPDFNGFKLNSNGKFDRFFFSS